MLQHFVFVFLLYSKFPQAFQLPLGADHSF